MALIDLHCHLDLYSDPTAVARRAANQGVYVLSVTTTPSAFEGTAALAPPGSRIRTALGLHPELAAARRHELDLFRKLLPGVDYVGEVGLDGSPPHRTTLDAQMEVLAEILDACAKEGGRILSLHSRGATETLLDLLQFEPAAGSFVLHWFSAKSETIARAAMLGCWFSVGPAMLATKSGRTAVMSMPKERILPETDGPFGTLGGEPFEPADSAHIYPELAELWNVSAQEVEAMLLTNFRQLTTSDRSAC